MQVVTSYPDGVFSWVDLMTSDADAAKVFYGGLFGWDVDDRPTDVGTIYTMLQIEGYNVAGLSGMSADMAAQGMPPVWTSYIKHDDVDSVAARVSAAGGNVMMPPMDVMDSGRMMMGIDPTGAIFGVWQPQNHIGAQLVNRPNALVWNELQTRDSKTASAFYGAVFGWTEETDQTGYVTFSQGGRPHAGMIQMDETWNASIPANWGAYFLVEDIDAAAAKVQELGGRLLFPPTPAGEIGKFSGVQDPQGGTFTIMQFNGPVDPPPGF